MMMFLQVYFITFALVAIVAADAEVQEPSVHLQPPNDSQQDFNAPWTEQHTWQPVADPEQPINVAQTGTYDNQYEGYSKQYPEQSQQFHDHNSLDNVPSSVAVQVNHPHCATSFSNVNRFDTQWPHSNSVASPAVAIDYHTEQPQPPVVDYSNNVVHSNSWSGNTDNAGNHHYAAVYQHQQHQTYGHSNGYGQYDSVSFKSHQPVAKYIAITPGSVHIAPLPGHTVSQKVLNLDKAGSW
ncbi:uncharacterized protein LOC128740906 [Sabethes cyaneus]|uniref:uncharacterized protein LOC128740906 n=1 Tax=Sabethes cyaneus TaxID=53552 RepID=UPI00237DA27A|nr:uncharacterized protein LOC128740906 [Sabethes cyaneus]